MFDLLILAAAGPSTASAPSAAEMEQAFANTIVSTYPDGREAKLWLERDGSYRAQGRRGDPSSGRWSLRVDKLCLKQSRPFPVPFSYCSPRVQAALGSSWAGKAITGEKVRIELRAGR